jgi:hypothetical protein
MSKIVLIILILIAAYLILTAVFGNAGAHLTVPTTSGPSLEGIQQFLHTLGL